MNKKKIVIINAHSGNIKNKKLVEGDFEEVLKQEAKQLLEKEWIPSFSDFMVLKDSIDIELQLPLTKEQVAFYREYNLRKTGPKTAMASLPIYFIVYESLKISEDKYHDRGVTVVAPYGREEDIQLLEELLKETTKKPSLEELEGPKLDQELLKEMDEEVEEYEKGKRGRKKKSK